jgi:O-antigen ligase
VSAFVSLHGWLVFGLFLALQDQPLSWRFFGLGSIFALLTQVLIGLAQFWTQSTAFLKPLGLNWPGDLTPATQGASVVQLADGLRWLRVYGTVPHPNLLGGLVFCFLVGLAALYLNQPRGKIWLMALFSSGVMLLVLTFSRSAWLALALFGLILMIFSRYFERKKLLALLVLTIFSLTLVILPLRDLILTRTISPAVKTEAFSTVARNWLAGQGWEFFQERPFSGVGMGAFILTLSQRAGIGYLIEPVHNIPLLAASELGVGGFFLLCGLATVILIKSIRSRWVTGLIFFAALAGLCLIGLFDHYLWTLAPGRVLWGTILGLWAGQIGENETRR